MSIIRCAIEKYGEELRYIYPELDLESVSAKPLKKLEKSGEAERALAGLSYLCNSLQISKECSSILLIKRLRCVLKALKEWRRGFYILAKTKDTFSVYVADAILDITSENLEFNKNIVDFIKKSVGKAYKINPYFTAHTLNLLTVLYLKSLLYGSAKILLDTLCTINLRLLETHPEYTSEFIDTISLFLLATSEKNILIKILGYLDRLGQIMNLHISMNRKEYVFHLSMAYVLYSKILIRLNRLDDAKNRLLLVRDLIEQIGEKGYNYEINIGIIEQELGNIALMKNEIDEAIEHFSLAETLIKKHIEKDIKLKIRLGDILVRLSFAYREKDMAGKALEKLKEVKEITEDLAKLGIDRIKYSLPEIYVEIGKLLSSLDNIEEALTNFRKAKRLYFQAIESGYNVDGDKLIVPVLHISNILAQQKKYREALEELGDLLGLLDKLVSSGEDEYIPYLAETYKLIGETFYEIKSLENALRFLSEAEKIYKMLVSEDEDYLEALSDTLFILGLTLYALRRWEDGLNKLLEAARITLELVRRGQDQLKQRLGEIYMQIGNLLDTIGMPTRAIEVYKKAELIFRDLLEKGSTTVIMDLIMLLANEGVMYNNIKQYEKAIEYLSEAEKFLSEITKGKPHPYLAWVLTSLGNALDDAKRPREALEKFERAEQIYRKLIEAGEKKYRERLAWTIMNIGVTLLRLNRIDEAITKLNEALEIKEIAASTYAFAHAHLITAHAMKKDKEAAMNTFISCLEGFPKFFSKLFVTIGGVSSAFREFSRVFSIASESFDPLIVSSAIEDLKAYCFKNTAKAFGLGDLPLDRYIDMKNTCDLHRVPASCSNLDLWETGIPDRFKALPFRFRLKPDRYDFSWIVILDTLGNMPPVIFVGSKEYGVKRIGLTRKSLERIINICNAFIFLDTFYHITITGDILGNYEFIAEQMKRFGITLKPPRSAKAFIIDVYNSLFNRVTEYINDLEVSLPELMEFLEFVDNQNDTLVISPTGVYTALPVELFPIGRPIFLRIPLMRSFSLTLSNIEIEAPLSPIKIMHDMGLSTRPLPLTFPEVEIIKKFGEDVGIQVNIIDLFDRSSIIEALHEGGILHYTGHGGRSTHSFTGLQFSYLALSNRFRVDYRDIFVSDPVGGLAFLSSCNSAFVRPERGGFDLYSLVASLFAEKYTVIAPLYPVLETHALFFVYCFYDSLKENLKIDEAILNTRKLFYNYYSREIASTLFYNPSTFPRYFNTWFFQIYGYPKLKFVGK